MIRHLTGSLIFATLLGGSGYALYAISKQTLTQARTHHEELRTELSTQRERLQRTQQDEPAVRSTIARFNKLGAAGVIGAEQRLDWVDHMRQIQRQLNLNNAVFALGPQKQIASLTNAAPYVIHGSSMQWHAALLHEGDLLRLLDELQRVDSAIVTPSACTLTTQDARSSETDSIDTECVFDWLTIAPSTAPGGKETP